jgi:hypothetical protein
VLDCEALRHETTVRMSEHVSAREAEMLDNAEDMARIATDCVFAPISEATGITGPDGLDIDER